MGEDLQSNAADPLARHARRIFRHWEWLRLWYNAALVVWVLVIVTVYYVGALGGPTQPLSLSFWLTVAQCGLVSNVFFFLGPVAELYLCWLGIENRALRLLLFLLGLAFTGFAALAVVGFLLATH